MTNTAENTTEEFRPLPESYQAHGHTFKLLKRGKKGVIYMAGENNRDENNVLIGKHVFEIFCIKVAKAVTIRAGGTETNVPRREKVPSDKDFGMWAWATTTEKHALRIFNNIESGRMLVKSNIHIKKTENA